MPDGPVQTPLMRAEQVYKENLREYFMGGWDKKTFLDEMDIATKNEVPMFVPGVTMPAYVFVTDAAQDVLDARAKILKCADAWDAAGKPAITTPYWETRG